MIIHNFDPVLIDLGFLQIKWYSIAYIHPKLIPAIYAIEYHLICNKPKSINTGLKLWTIIKKKIYFINKLNYLKNIWKNIISF